VPVETQGPDRDPVPGEQMRSSSRVFRGYQVNFTQNTQRA
jgi:hypothetical protein